MPPTPAQVGTMKARDPDALLLFHVGDEYLLFAGDVKVAAPLLDLDPIPTAAGATVAFPAADLERHLATLVAAGRVVAVYEPARGGGA